MREPAFKTKHGLPFEVADYPIQYSELVTWKLFRVGTCEGLWRAEEGSFVILAVTNNSIGNGHFDDVLQWFEFSCKRYGYDFKISEVWNHRLKRHLIKKCGFIDLGNDNLIKYMKNEKKIQKR